VPERRGPEKAVLIRNGTVLPMDGRRTAIAGGSVLLTGSVIAAVGPVEALDRDPRAAGAEIVDATGTAVIPGLHNCHLHSGLLRGTAESLSLWDWLKIYVDPAHRALTPEIAEAAALQCYAESILAGTTSVMDMWRFMEGSARVADSLGLRATLVPYVADEEGYDYFESVESNRALLESVGTGAADGRVRAWVGLEHLLYCTEHCFRQALQLADEYGTGLHTHSSETTWEVDESIRRFAARPIEVLRRRGILGPKTVIAHCVWLDGAEIDWLAATGTSVAHCPCSNMKLASGPAPVAALRAAGVAVGLGSDGEKENNNLDLLEEMKFASLLAKVSQLDPTAGNPWDVLTMATAEGARVLGLGSVTGSLEPGKDADVVTVALDGLHTTPVLRAPDFNVHAHLVFSAKGSDVRDVWVRGRPLVRDRRPTTFDVESVRRGAQAAAEELFARRAALDPPPN
jgi:5-methylthioadenosine/S-adenosylhomocysteine deaminase